MDLKFRKLKAGEISVRIKQVGESKGKVWAMMLLYKDARCDMAILDETVGAMNWQREHSTVNGDMFCSVGIKDENGVWVWKQDCGTEGDSGTEAEKSRASDSFKRACTNWGIGRELYTPIRIVITLEGDEIMSGSHVKASPRARFYVSEVGYSEEGAINLLKIVDKNGKERFNFKGAV